jgi:hypothetical protein
MKRLQKKKRLLGWLMATLMVLPSVVKASHTAIYHKQDVTMHTLHDCNDCPVCRFAFSLFIETESFDIEKTVYCLDFKTFIYKCETVNRIIRYFNLRAPPV